MLFFKHGMPCLFLTYRRNVPFLILHSCCFNFFKERCLICRGCVLLLADTKPGTLLSALLFSRLLSCYSQTASCLKIRLVFQGGNSFVLELRFFSFISLFFLSETDCKDNATFLFPQAF